jgi:hypothetical protein
MNDIVRKDLDIKIDDTLLLLLLLRDMHQLFFSFILFASMIFMINLL